MYAFNAAALLALAGAAAAQPTLSPVPVPTGVKNGTVTVTSVVDVYTTYCPGPTSFHLGGKDYVVTKPTTLIITDCPCTVTETHPAGPTWIPGHPGYKPEHPDYKPGHPDYKPEHPEVEKPGKPEHPDYKPEHPEVEKPGKPEPPVQPEHPEVEKPAQPENPTTPEKPEGEKPGKEEEEVPEEPVVTAGAGAVQFGLGLAAFLGLIAL
jgi:hypothetical protein